MITKCKSYLCQWVW